MRSIIILLLALLLLHNSFAEAKKNIMKCDAIRFWNRLLTKPKKFIILSDEQKKDFLAIWSKAKIIENKGEPDKVKVRKKPPNYCIDFCNYNKNNFLETFNSIYIDDKTCLPRGYELPEKQEREFVQFIKQLLQNM